MDERVLNTLLNQVFSDYSKPLVQHESAGAGISNTVTVYELGLHAPKFENYSDIVSWIHRLPDNTPPDWLGLNPNSEIMLQTNHSIKCLRNLALIQDSDDTMEDIEANTNQFWKDGISLCKNILNTWPKVQLLKES